MSSDGRTQLWRIVFLSIALSLPGSLFAVVVTGFSPASGSTGTVVTITGGPFVPGWTIAVTFNSVIAPSFTIDSSTQITATAPVGLSPGPITVFDVFTGNFTTLGLWLMDGATITGGGYVGAAGGYQVVGVADFDFDGRADILFSDATGNLGMWLMSAQTIIGGGLVGAPGQYTVAAVKDYDDDGKYDILLRNPSTGDVRVWLMSGPSINTDAPVSPLPLVYSIQ